MPAPVVAKPQADDTGTVRTGTLGRLQELVTALGGDASALLGKSQIDAALLADENGAVAYRSLAQVLEHAAAELACPDFGMRLAAAQARQGATKALGPMGVAMRHAPTLREALQYLVHHMHACSTATRLCMEKLPGDGRVFMAFEIVPANPAQQRQAVEHALALTRHVVDAISKGQARVSEVWFSHAPLNPTSVYRANFGATARFGQSMNGLFFEERDLDLPVPERDAQLHEIATSYIERRFPGVPMRLSTRVRIIITHLLADSSCSHERVAARLGLHPRTLQRRLRDEGESFEGIKDQVRRDVALRHLGQANISLVKMTEILGYSETSVLSRSCLRWFSASPRQLRKGQRRSAADPAPCSLG
ncbi:MAG TPA: AraC family transcriptional regulator [Solimonas sp.]|nr:AraC family transcriptional regulator [Solimonas sp.]